MNLGLSWIWRHELAADEALGSQALRLWRGARPAGKLARGWAVTEPPRDTALGAQDVLEGTGVEISAWIDVIEPLWMWVALSEGAHVVSARGGYADPGGGGGLWLYAGGSGAALDLTVAGRSTQVRWGTSLVLGTSPCPGDAVDAFEQAIRDGVAGIVQAWVDGAPDALAAAVATLVSVRRGADAVWRRAEGLERARWGSRLLAADAALARLAPWILPWLPSGVEVSGPEDDGRGWWTGDGFPALGPVGEAGG
ncbi:MAG: hypothetical protein RLZZ383_2769 [Pseudomonadota bacterium]